MSIEVANADCTVDHSEGSPVSGGSVVITPPTTLKSKAGGKLIHAGGVSVTWTGCSGGGSSNLAGTGIIPPTAEKAKAENKLINRKGDSVTIAFAGTTSSVPPSPVALNGDVEITDAGQVKVKCK